MTRVAACSCGQLSVSVAGEPDRVVVCHCLECQKSTGSAFGFSTYWPKVAVRDIAGERRLYRRGSYRGRSVDNYFCPTCGSTVFWYMESAPESIGISGGNFADPNFPAPEVSTWNECRHPWAELAVIRTRYRRQRQDEEAE